MRRFQIGQRVAVESWAGEAWEVEARVVRCERLRVEVQLANGLVFRLPLRRVRAL